MNLNQLYDIITSRRNASAEQSYTARLFAEGENKILKKVNEEATEVIIAAKAEGDQRLIEESADLIYHLLVLLASRNLTPEDIFTELEHRHTPR